jgi:hypothetical protein
VCDFFLTHLPNDYELFGGTNENANVNEIELQMLSAGTDLN